MDRRLFIGGTVAASLMPQLAASAQDSDYERAAVVIGVDVSGDLPVLSAAANGARQFAEFLRGEGFETVLLSDEKKADGTREPVAKADVSAAVRGFVERGSVGQIVVYFAGHGFLNSQSEVWFLSGAPGDSDEAVNVERTRIAAMSSGIINVTLIADTCRSLATSTDVENVIGGSIFPNRSVEPNPDYSVDVFYATAPGQRALELTIAESTAQYEGIFTAALLDAFKTPDDDMPYEVDGVGPVVPNRNLRRYLYREVNKRAQAKSIKLKQLPQAYVLSDVPTYFGRVQPNATLRKPEVSVQDVSVQDVADVVLSTNVSEAYASDDPQLVQLSKFDIGNVAKASKLNSLVEELQAGGEAVQALIVDDKPASNQESEEIIRVHVLGADVASVHTSPLIGAPDMQRRDAPTRDVGSSALTTIIVDMKNEKGASLAIRLADGTGFVIGALRRFYASATLTGKGVTDINYEPNRFNDYSFAYEESKERLLKARAAVSAASEFGALQFDGTREERERKASAFADQTRLLKGFDATMGIYASYAYASANLFEKVKSVHGFMSGDLQLNMFDVAMLAGALRDIDPANREARVVPFCPMQTQGWNYLEAQGVRLSPRLRELQKHLLPSLWTMLDAKGMDLVIEGLQSGEFN